MAGQCTPEYGGAVTGAQSEIAQELGWLNVFDYYGAYSDTTRWLQESINTAELSGLPLYFPPTSGGVPAPYCITGTLSVSGSIHIFGQPAQSAFAQGGPSNYPVTGATRAMIWTELSDFDMLCVDLEGDTANGLMENIDFCVLPLHTEETTASAMRVYGSSWRVVNSVLYGPMNGVNCLGASQVELNHVTIIPFANETSGRFGLFCAAPGGTGPGPAATFDCLIDQTQYPFSGPEGSPILHTVNGIVVEANYNSLAFQRTTVKGADSGFKTVSGEGDVDFYFLMESKTYNCNVGINFEQFNFGGVHNCFVSVDSSSGSPATPSGIIASSSLGGELVIRNCVIVGNGTAPMVGLALEGPAAIAVAGGAILNCGESSETTLPGDGIFIDGPAGAQFTLGGIVVSGCSQAGVHVGAEHEGTALITNLALQDNESAVLIEALTGDPSEIGITIVDCWIADNAVGISNQNAAVTTGASPLAIKLANNTGYNPTGPVSGVPQLVRGVVYVNNTGVDQSVYLGAPSPGTAPDGPVAITNPLNNTPTTGVLDGSLSTFIVPAGATIALEGIGPISGWSWVGN